MIAAARRLGWLAALALLVALSGAQPHAGLAEDDPPLAQLDGGTPAIQTDAPGASTRLVGVPLPNGWFVASAAEGLGYAVVDEPGGPPFWTAYQALGGPATLGLPLSRPFTLPDARVYQATQMGLLAWRPGSEAAGRADVLDMMAAAGLDDFLLARGIPRAERDVVAAVRVGWLADASVRAAYFGTGAIDGPQGATPPLAPAEAVARFGLPMSPLTSAGGVTVQRFQRAALRVQLDDAGSVMDVQWIEAGALLRESGLLTAAALAPDRLFDGGLAPRGTRPALTWPSDTGWGIQDAPSAPVRPAPTLAVPALPGQGGQGGQGGSAAGATAGPVVAATAAATASPVSPAGGTPVAAEPTLPAIRTTVSGATPTARQGSSATATPVPALLQPGAALAIREVVNAGRAEHVVVANDGSVAQELTGWTLRSAMGNQTIAFPAGFVLAAGATVNVHSGSGDAALLNRPPTDLYPTRANIWNNSGDRAQLIDPTGRLVAERAYGA